jgi:hypothetical protein
VAGDLTPSRLVTEIYPALAAAGPAVFIHLVPLDALRARCAELEAQPAGARGPLWGVPFAVKDNIDVAGLPSTAACPAYEYLPDASAPTVAALLDAGARAARRGRWGGDGVGGARVPGRCRPLAAPAPASPCLAGLLSATPPRLPPLIPRPAWPPSPLPPQAA